MTDQPRERSVISEYKVVIANEWKNNFLIVASIALAVVAIKNLESFGLKIPYFPYYQLATPIISTFPMKLQIDPTFREIYSGVELVIVAAVQYQFVQKFLVNRAKIIDANKWIKQIT